MRARSLIMLLLAVCGACGDDDRHAGTDASTDGPRPDVPPTGAATLTFRAIQGEQAGAQIDAEWREGAPGWEPDATLVVMLCATDDPTCERPILFREVTPAESDGAPLAPTTGPLVTLTGLPEGDYLLVVLADSTRSRELGLAWDDDFETTETAWGGVASEGDLLLSAADDVATTDHNPSPAPRAVSLASGRTEDAGTLVLGHYHERDLSPRATAEAGTLVVAVDEGLRLFDLATFAPIEESTIRMVDTAGAPVAGTVCGLIRGPAETVYVLYVATTGGFAIQYDVAARAQLHEGRRINFPGLAGDTPCRGIYHERSAGQQILWIANAPAAPDAPPQPGMWYARIDDLPIADMVAEKLGTSHDVMLGVGVSGFVADGNALYAAVSAAAGDSRVPAAAQGRHVAFRASTMADGFPTFAEPSGARVIVQGPALGAGAGSVACDAELGTSGIARATFHDGRRLLFLGGCLEIAAFDLGMDPPARIDPNLDASGLGQGFAAFTVSSDGETLWALPQRPSPLPFSVDAGGTPVELPRQAALPIDLSSGDRPGLRAGLGVDVDGDSAIDPGIDLGFVAYERYILSWAPALSTALLGPSIDLSGVLGAATEETLFVGAPGGLRKAGELATYDIPRATGHLWPREAAPYYGIWTGGPDPSPRFGFHASPEATGAVHGVLTIESP